MATEHRFSPLPAFFQSVLQVLVVSISSMLYATDVLSWPPDEEQRKQWNAFSNDLNLQTLRQFLEKLVSNGERSSVWVNQVVNNSGETILHKAVEKGNAPVVALLLSFGASPNVCNVLKETPLSIAILLKRWVVVFLLLSNGGRFQDNLANQRRVQRDFLQWLEQLENYERYQRLGQLRRLFIWLSCGVIRSLPENPYRETPLHRAVRSGCIKSIIHHLEHRPQQRFVQRADGCTPLHVAVLHGQLQALALLLSFHCLNQNTQLGTLQSNHDNQDPVQLSLNTDMYNYLSSYRLSLSSPLHVAVRHGDLKLIEFLINQPVISGIVNYRCRGGITALHIASFSGNSIAVAHLMMADADPSIEDDEQQTPLDLARRNPNSQDYEQIIELLDMFYSGFRVLVFIGCIKLMYPD